MREGELSKRWIANFDRKRAEANVQFFRTGLKIEPVVHVWWSSSDVQMTLPGRLKAWAYVVAEDGHKPWDVTEVHICGAMNGKPGHDVCTTFTADEFLAQVKVHPGSWYHEAPEKPFGRLSYEPFDEKRGVKGYVDCVYQP